MLLLIFPRDTVASVLNFDNQRHTQRWVHGLARKTQRHAAQRGELDSVADKIENHLTEFSFIGNNHTR